MTDIYYFAFSIDQNNMRDTVHTVVLTAGRSGTVEVLNFLPFLGLDMFDHSWGSLIDTDANNADFVSPSVTMMLKHLLIVSHGLLARWAPSGPEINKHDLPGLVIDILRLLLIDVCDLCDLLVGSTHAHLDLDFDIG
jgi:hypothetical protein